MAFLHFPVSPAKRWFSAEDPKPAERERERERKTARLQVSRAHKKQTRNGFGNSVPKTNRLCHHPRHMTFAVSIQSGPNRTSIFHVLLLAPLGQQRFLANKKADLNVSLHGLEPLGYCTGWNLLMVALESRQSPEMSPGRTKRHQKADHHFFLFWGGSLGGLVILRQAFGNPPLPTKLAPFAVRWGGGVLSHPSFQHGCSLTKKSMG